ncbi:MAG: tRNA glutamyl-Q(34) synthetase GluQRS [Aquirhabdus sp.]
MSQFTASTPTGPLHFGSLVTALASWCEARKQHGHWLVRIEDTDIPRNQMGAEQSILTALTAYGLHADSPIERQQDHLEAYNLIIEALKAQNLVYACSCSRKQLTGLSAYPNTCRDKNLPFEGNAIRLKTPDEIICFTDRIQGQVCENLRQTTGDFVLRRRDGIISYQLAVVVDDMRQGVTDIVRGADLLDNTVRQIWLRKCLNTLQLPHLSSFEPTYYHIPLAMNAQGQKLSKQNLAMPLETTEIVATLQKAFVALGQDLIEADTPEEFLQRAVECWDLRLVPRHGQLEGVFL